jgi:hypothetical protein
MYRAYPVSTPGAAESHFVVESAEKLRHRHRRQPETTLVSHLTP